MSNYFILKSKHSLSDKILHKMLKNTKSKYISNEKILYKFKSKKFFYNIGITDKKKILKKNSIILILSGSIFNLKLRKKENIINRIFKMYNQDGLNSLKTLDGSFSIVLINIKNDNLITIRDRHGSSLLFYKKDKNYLCIFTKIKFLKKIDFFKLKPNLKLIKKFIFEHYRYSYGGQDSFFYKVNLFKHNSINILKNNTFYSKVLFKFKIKNTNTNKNINQLKKKFINLLIKSLKKRYPEVQKKSGFFLSGGLDSPTIAGITAKHFNKRLRTFSIAYKEKNHVKNEMYYDESLLIKKILDNNIFDSTFIYPNSKNFISTFHEMLEVHDEPISSPTWYSHYLACKTMHRKKIKYVFGGDGGDHLLAGLYDDIPYFLADLKFYKNKNFEYELQKWTELHDHPIFRKNKEIFEIYLKKCFKKKNKGKIFAYTWDESLMRKNNIYKKLRKKNLKIEKKKLFPSITKSFLKSKLIQDLHYTSSPPSTRAEIPNFSNFGIECRSAFLDEEIVKFCWNLPIQYMIKDGYTKWLIRETLKGYLPSEVLWNKKHIGLNAPANIWFRYGLKKELKKTINNFLKRKNFNFFNNFLLNQILSEHFNKKKDHMMFLWKIYSLEKWLYNWNFKQ